jgi:hypothetical protein
MAESKKQSIKMSVIGEPQSLNPTGKQLLKAVREAKKLGAQAPEERVSPAVLISTNDFPVAVKYGESSIRVSPRARLQINDSNLLPSQLPSGIHLKKLNG